MLVQLFAVIGALNCLCVVVIGIAGLTYSIIDYLSRSRLWPGPSLPPLAIPIVPSVNDSNPHSLECALTPEPLIYLYLAILLICVSSFYLGVLYSTRHRLQSRQATGHPDVPFLRPATSEEIDQAIEYIRRAESDYGTL